MFDSLQHCHHHHHHHLSPIPSFSLNNAPITYLEYEGKGVLEEIGLATEIPTEYLDEPLYVVWPLWGKAPRS